MLSRRCMLRGARYLGLRYLTPKVPDEWYLVQAHGAEGWRKYAAPGYLVEGLVNHVTIIYQLHRFCCQQHAHSVARLSNRDNSLIACVQIPGYVEPGVLARGYSSRHSRSRRSFSDCNARTTHLFAVGKGISRPLGLWVCLLIEGGLLTAFKADRQQRGRAVRSFASAFPPKSQLPEATQCQGHPLVVLLTTRLMHLIKNCSRSYACICRPLV